MTRRDPCLLQLKHGALLVLTIIFAVTAGMLIKIYETTMIKKEMNHESYAKNKQAEFLSLKLLRSRCERKLREECNKSLIK